MKAQLIQRNNGNMLLKKCKPLSQKHKSVLKGRSITFPPSTWDTETALSHRQTENMGTERSWNQVLVCFKTQVKCFLWNRVPQGDEITHISSTKPETTLKQSEKHTFTPATTAFNLSHLKYSILYYRIALVPAVLWQSQNWYFSSHQPSTST